MKKIKIFAVLLLISTICSAQEVDSESREIPPTEISKLDTSFHYYGLPLQAKIGWLYQYNDFSIFPNTGIIFDVDVEPKIVLSAGLSVRKGIFSWSANVFYNLLPFTMTKPLEEQEVSFVNNFSAAFSGGNIVFPGLVGRTGVSPIKNTSNSSKEIEKIVTIIGQGIGFNLFLLDVGFFKSTASALFSIRAIPDDKFFSYTVSFDLPATFSLYYVDIALMYQFLHSDELVFDSITPSTRYNVGNKWSSVTGRTTFSPDNQGNERYQTINSGELELRWYMLRHFIHNSNFFISAFSQIGWGLSDTQSSTFLYEYGMGLGYTLFDSVPFTFQVGIDKNFKPTFYLSAVSKITHRP